MNGKELCEEDRPKRKGTGPALDYSVEDAFGWMGENE
jgi:hypothetical protein